MVIIQATAKRTEAAILKAARARAEPDIAIGMTGAPGKTEAHTLQ